VTPAPVSDFVPCPVVPEVGCSICGEGRCVTDYYAFFQEPGQPDSFCGFLELSGLNGELDSFVCSSLGRVIQDTCVCATKIPREIGRFDPRKLPPITLSQTTEADYYYYGEDSHNSYEKPRKEIIKPSAKTTSWRKTRSSAETRAPIQFFATFLVTGMLTFAMLG